jgi:DNA modification methylase
MQEIKQAQQESPNNSWMGTASSGHSWQVFCGDSSKILEQLEDDSVDCVVTSPPYYCLRDYKVEGQIGLEDSVEGYINAICKVMDQARRVLKPTGTLFINLGDTYYSGKGKSHGIDPKSNKRRFGLRAVDKSGGLGINLLRKSIIGVPWRVAIRMAARNWVLRSPIIWHRKKCLPEAVLDRPRRSYEYVFMFVKSKKYFFNRQLLIDKKIEEDMWTVTARPKNNNGIDTAPFPDELVKRCIDIGCPSDGVVLDPFAGSGTTLRVALSSGRSAIGIDLNKTFCEFMVNELREL